MSLLASTTVGRFPRSPLAGVFSSLDGGWGPASLPNLAAWYDASDASTITIVTGVSAWADKSGNGRTLLQATGANQPQYFAAGRASYLLFDGSNDYLKTAPFTLNQPETVYFVGQQVTNTNTFYILDGNAAASMGFRQAGSGNVGISAGSPVANTAVPLATNVVLIGVFNGASSSLRLNLAAANTGNAGAANGGGLTLGAVGSLTNTSNIQVRAVLIYSAAHSTATQNRVIRYLMSYYGIAG